MTDGDDPAPDESREYRLGPFVFVPGFRPRSGDRWAHRKGEPRIFALFWSIYLMLCALSTVFVARAIGVPQASRFRYGAAALLVMVCLGATMLWCMTRLSQRSPARPLRSVGADLVVILVPLQAVVWPMPILTGWPLEIVAGLALLLTSWTLLASVVVLFGSGSNSHLERALWMLLCVAGLAAAPLAFLALNRSTPGAAPDALLLWSPLTAIYALTASPENLTPVMTTDDWIAAAWPSAVAVPAWLLRATRNTIRRRTPEPDRTGGQSGDP